MVFRDVSRQPIPPVTCQNKFVHNITMRPRGYYYGCLSHEMQQMCFCVACLIDTVYCAMALIMLCQMLEVNVETDATCSSELAGNAHACFVFSVYRTLNFLR